MIKSKMNAFGDYGMDRSIVVFKKTYIKIGKMIQIFCY